MAIYYINGEKINIPTHKKTFGQGSEGCLYLVEDKLTPSRNVGMLSRMIDEERHEYKYSEYFEQIAETEESIHEFLIKKGKSLIKR